MSVPRLLIILARLTALALALALAGLVALIAPSTDNSPYMTPFAAVLIALASTLALIGYLGHLPEPTTEVPPATSDQPSASPD